MNDVSDMSQVIIPKADQISADDLLAGPITIRIASVSIRPGTEQPVSIHFEGDGGRPWKPCKSMSRVLVAAWGADANAYTGRSVTLYRDPDVKWGGLAVGGIRVSHLSDIKGAMVLALTATKGSKKAFKVEPLQGAPAKSSAPPRRTTRQWLDDLGRDLAKAAEEGAPAVEARLAMGDVQAALAALQNGAKAELQRLIDTARAGYTPSDAAFLGDGERMET